MKLALRRRLSPFLCGSITSRDQVGSSLCVIQQIKLPIHFIGGIVFDVLEGKRPSPSQCTQLTASSAPGSEMAVSAMVGNVAGFVGGNSGFSALAFRCRMMVVEFSLINTVSTEVASHSLLVALLFCGLRFSVQHKRSRRIERLNEC